jgi:hypothetical protein
LISAASVNPFNSAPGTVGARRIQIEWNIISAAGLRVSSAVVRLNTLRGTVDAFDTQFYAITTDANGNLDDADFERPAALINGALMPVPAVPPGTSGLFEFDVTAWVQNAIDNGFGFFSVQGRIANESLPFPGNDPRGLEVRSTADNNIIAGLEPGSS